MNGKRRWYLLLLIPFIGTLVPQWFNHPDPPLFGFPFFYWYQMLWVILTPFLMGVVVIATRERNDV